jgi:hypothetical protein
VRRPLLLKDSWPTGPGYVTVTSPQVRDAQRMARDARQAWLRDLTSAWKRGAVSRDAGSEPDASGRLFRGRTEPDADDAARRRRAALRARDEQLVNAWRMGRADPREADRIERQRRGWTAEDCP